MKGRNLEEQSCVNSLKRKGVYFENIMINNQIVGIGATITKPLGIKSWGLVDFLRGDRRKYHFSNQTEKRNQSFI